MAERLASRPIARGWTWWAIAAGAVAAHREPVAPRAKRRVSGPARRRYRRDASRPRFGSAARLDGGRSRRSLALIAVSLIAIAAQRELWRSRHTTGKARAATSPARGLSALKRALDDATQDGARRARAALEVAADSLRDRAFDELSTRRTRPGRRRRRRLPPGQRASRGPATFAPRSTRSRDGTTIVATPFYLALQVTQRRGDDRAVVAVLLDAAPPADRFVSTLAQPIADRAGLKEFKFFRRATPRPPGRASLRHRGTSACSTCAR